MACNCGGGSAGVRLVTFLDGSTTLVGSEAEARGEVATHGGGSWRVLRGQEAVRVRAEHAARARAQAKG